MHLAKPFPWMHLYASSPSTGVIFYSLHVAHLYWQLPPWAQAASYNAHPPIGWIPISWGHWVAWTMSFGAHWPGPRANLSCCADCRLWLPCAWTMSPRPDTCGANPRCGGFISLTITGSSPGWGYSLIT